MHDHASGTHGRLNFTYPLVQYYEIAARILYITGDYAAVSNSRIPMNTILALRPLFFILFPICIQPCAIPWTGGISLVLVCQPLLQQLQAQSSLYNPIKGPKRQQIPNPHHPRIGPQARITGGGFLFNKILITKSTSSRVSIFPLASFYTSMGGLTASFNNLYINLLSKRASLYPSLYSIDPWLRFPGLQIDDCDALRIANYSIDLGSFANTFTIV